MAVKRTRSSSNPSFKCIWLLDVAVLASIWLIAGRADGLAIALSALIVTALVFLARRLRGAKTAIQHRANRASANQSGRVAQQLAPMPDEQRRRPERSGHWLRQD